MFIKPKSSTKSKFETFYVQYIASESDSGCIFLPADQYVNPFILNEILEVNNSFPSNTDGDMEVWTTNPDLQPKSEWECVNYVSEDELEKSNCYTLFDLLVKSEYRGIGDRWRPRFLSVTWSDRDGEDVEEAICNYLDAAPSQADLDEYKRLKAKLGL
jgi:hypothetical protein